MGYIDGCGYSVKQALYVLMYIIVQLKTKCSDESEKASVLVQRVD